MPPLPEQRASFARLVVPAAAPAPLASLARGRLVVCLGREATSTLYRYELLVLGPAHGATDLGALLGQPLAVAIQTAAAERFIHGHVAAAQALDARRLRLTLRPFLALADLNRTCRIFQERDARAIVDEVLSAYPAIARLDWRATETLPQRRYCVQYEESDARFVMRLLEEEGLAFHFEHRADGHALVVTDPASALASAEGGAHLAYRPVPREADRTEGVRRWQARARVVADRVELVDYDFKKPARIGAEAGEPGCVQFDFPGRFHDDPAAEGPAGAHARLSAQRAQVALERLRTPTHVCVGSSDARGLAPGRAFTLTDHPDATQNRRYRLLATRTRLRQPADEADRSPPDYRCRLRAMPADQPFRPALVHARPKLPAHSARVSGPAHGRVHVDRFGRVQLAFHWDRSAGGEATRTCWVRVSQAWAGAGFGASFLPRVGDEVLVRFLENDPDRPVVVARLPNAENLPVEFAATGTLPGNHALAGVRSQELGGAGANQLLFDDTHQAIRAQLESTHGATQLGLGFLTHPRDAANAAPRGEGFELRTDQWGALRAPKGILLCAEGARPIGAALDHAASERILRSALALANALNEAERGVVPGSMGGTQEAREILAKVLKDWPAPKQFGHPDHPIDQGAIALHGEAGIAIASGAAATLAADTIDLVAQANAQSASGQRTQLSAGRGVALHAHGDGLRWIAGQGPLRLQAQADELRLEASRNAQISASEGGVRIEAHGPITLGVEGGGYIKLAQGNVEIGGPQALLVRMGLGRLTGPGSARVSATAADSCELDKGFQVFVEGRDGPLANFAYQITRDGAELARGVTDAQGRTVRSDQDHYDPLDLHRGDPPVEPRA